MKDLMCYVSDIALQSTQLFEFKTYKPIKLCLSKLKLGLANSTKHMDSILCDSLFCETMSKCSRSEPLKVIVNSMLSIKK